mmetsp:Transcript_7178/g.29140  ORF Transcript_7178/g.29140 Transcript_7178/m.29140 type:complete len:246 (+) Transcript_7178:93-830(+)
MRTARDAVQEGRALGDCRRRRRRRPRQPSAEVRVAVDVGGGRGASFQRRRQRLQPTRAHPPPVPKVRLRGGAHQQPLRGRVARARPARPQPRARVRAEDDGSLHLRRHLHRDAVGGGGDDVARTQNQSPHVRRRLFHRVGEGVDRDGPRVFVEHVPGAEQQAGQGADPARRESLVVLGRQPGEERQKLGQDIRRLRHRRVELRGEVDHQLQAVLAGLVQPRVRLGVSVPREGPVPGMRGRFPGGR